MDVPLAVMIAKMWALELLDRGGWQDIKLSIDVSMLDDTTQILLAPVHQSFKTKTLHGLNGDSEIKDVWWSDLCDGKLVYTNGNACRHSYELAIYEDSHSAYAFICKEHPHEMAIHDCLVFWAKRNLINKNPGYGPGRFGNGTRII